MTTLEHPVEIFIRRDGMTRREAEYYLADTLLSVDQAIAAGEDPEEVWQYETGLEPDYLFMVFP